MHPDLVIRAYRHQERELEQRLAHRRVALERAAALGATSASTRRPAPALARAVAHRVAAARAAVRSANATLRRGRQAVADAYASDCCAAA